MRQGDKKRVLLSTVYNQIMKNMKEKRTETPAETRLCGVTGEDSGTTPKGAGAWQRIKLRGFPADIDPADPSGIQSVTPPAGVDGGEPEEIRAACLAARDMARHYAELAGVHQRLALAAKKGLYELAGKMQPACEAMLELANESAPRELRRRMARLELAVHVLAVLLLAAVVYMVGK